MKADKKIKFPPEIEEVVRRMARASFRTFEEESAELVRKGLQTPGGSPVTDEVVLTAELAFLRDAEVEESTEGPQDPPRRRGLLGRILHTESEIETDPTRDRHESPPTLGVFF